MMEDARENAALREENAQWREAGKVCASIRRENDRLRAHVAALVKVVSNFRLYHYILSPVADPANHLRAALDRATELLDAPDLAALVRSTPSQERLVAREQARDAVIEEARALAAPDRVFLVRQGFLGPLQDALAALDAVEKQTP